MEKKYWYFGVAKMKGNRIDRILWGHAYDTAELAENANRLYLAKHPGRLCMVQAFDKPLKTTTPE